MRKKDTIYYDLKGSGHYDFVGKTKILVSISVVLLLISFYFVFVHGLNYGIDFKGGTEIQVAFSKKVDTSQVRSFLEDLKIKEPQIQKFGDQSEYLIRFQGDTLATAKETNESLNTMVHKITDGLKTTFANDEPVVKRVDSVGPQVGSQLKKNSLLAVFYSLFLILIYIGLRFDYIYAPGAVIGLFHDAVITMGILAILQKEITVQILAAILTIIGYSLNDTIVIYDRIREDRPAHTDKQLPWVINNAINEMLGRTISTSLTTFACIGCLYFFADGAIKDFAFAMLIGIVIGVYSTVYISSPLVMFFDHLEQNKKSAAAAR